MFSRFDGDKLSLNDICNELGDKFGCDIRKQSLDGRFNKGAVNFIKSVISKSLSKKINSNNITPFLNNFNAVKIQDSTNFQISENLSEYYPGSGGSASTALARIQFEYDIKNMEISTLELTSGRYADITFAKDNMDSVNKGDLLIRDLGYVSGTYMRDVIEKEAFFVNRIDTKRIVYLKDSTGDFVKLDFDKLLSNMKQDNFNSAEFEAYILVDKKYIKIRLIAEKLPDDVYAERIRKAKLVAKKHGSKLKKEYLQKAWFNLFVTNVDKKILKSRELNYLYSIRWQIELIFKSWKSTFNLAKIKKMQRYRFECQIYARLLLIVLSWNMFSFINNSIINDNKRKTPCILSYYKFNKIVCARLESFILAIIFNGMWFNRFVTNLISTSILSAQQIEPKSKTISSIHIFEYTAYNADIVRIRTELIA